MKKLISVIVPIYNSECYMKKCLDSLVNQSYRDLEIILVNDGSNDMSLDICKKYKQKDNRVIILDKPNGGAASARNAGLNVAKGYYISFIDSDDWIEYDTYELLSKEFVNDYDIIIFGSYNEYENGKVKEAFKYSKRMELTSEEAIIKMNSFSGITNGPSDKLYKRSLFYNRRFPEGIICEDYYIMPVLFGDCTKILFTPLIKYHYFIRNNSVSRSATIKYEYISASDAQRDYIRKNYPNIMYVGNTAYVFSNIMVYNTMIRNGMQVNKDFLKKHDDFKKYKKDIIVNKYLPIKKKLQALIFIDNLKIYNLLILHLKRKSR